MSEHEQIINITEKAISHIKSIFYYYLYLDRALHDPIFHFYFGQRTPSSKVATVSSGHKKDARQY